MFQKSSYNAYNTDIFCPARNSWNKAANSPYAHVNFYTGTRGLYQGIDYRFVCKRIYFYADISLISCEFFFLFSFDIFYYFALKAIWRNEQERNIINNFAKKKILENGGTIA